MTKRPSSHVSGDIALSYVQIQLLEAGWAVDRIVSDYGEDLLVKPKRSSGEVDAFHVLVQVKGRKGNFTDTQNTWSIAFEIKHLERWVRMREPVIVVLWSHKSNTGRFCRPRQLLSLAEILNPTTISGYNGKTIPLLFKREDTMTQVRLEELAWELRLDFAGEIDHLWERVVTEAEKDCHFTKHPISVRNPRSSQKYKNELDAKDKQKDNYTKGRDCHLDEVLALLGICSLTRQSLDNQTQEVMSDPNNTLMKDEIQQSICERIVIDAVMELSGSGLSESLASHLGSRLLELNS